MPPLVAIPIGISASPFGIVKLRRTSLRRGFLRNNASAGKSSAAWQITERLCRENTDGPIFRSRIRNKPYSKAALVERFRKLRAHVDFHASPYTIRHTFATDAILQGVDLITIKELMGHEDLRMLEKIYQHVKKRGDHLRAGLAKATGHLNGVS